MPETMTGRKWQKEKEAESGIEQCLKECHEKSARYTAVAKRMVSRKRQRTVLHRI